MELTRAQVRDGIIQCLRELLGDRDTLEIDDRTNPIKDLGLDSEDGVAMACALSEKFKCDISNDINPFVDDDRDRGRRVGEIVDLVQDLIASR